MRAHRKNCRPGEHKGTKYSREVVQSWRDMMRPPLRMRPGQVAKLAGVSIDFMNKKFFEYEI